jgi:hypothetical protein
VEREGPDGGREALIMLLCEREGEWRREREVVERESGVCV